jgi:hypothetical protein
MIVKHLEKTPNHTPYRYNDTISVLVSDYDFIMVYWESGAVTEYCAHEPLPLEHWSNWKQFIKDARYHNMAADCEIVKSFVSTVRHQIMELDNVQSVS